MGYYNFLGKTGLITSLLEGSLGLGPYLSFWFYCEVHLSSRNALFLISTFPQIFEIAILGDGGCNFWFFLLESIVTFIYWGCCKSLGNKTGLLCAFEIFWWSLGERCKSVGIKAVLVPRKLLACGVFLLGPAGSHSADISVNSLQPPPILVKNCADCLLEKCPR